MTRIPHPTTAECYRGCLKAAELLANLPDTHPAIAHLRLNEIRPECALLLGLIEEARRRAVVNAVIENDEVTANMGAVPQSDRPAA